MRGRLRSLSMTFGLMFMFGFLCGIVVGILLAAAYPWLITIAKPVADAIGSGLRQVVRQVRQQPSATAVKVDASATQKQGGDDQQ